MDIEKLIEQYRQAADKWEKRNPVTDTFDLRVQDALRDAAAALSTLQTENEKLRGELESVRAERNAAVEDAATIIGAVEEIRRGYGVDNADADVAFAELCETYCVNNGRLCYAECEKYHCKNFKWRGQKEG